MLQNLASFAVRWIGLAIGSIGMVMAVWFLFLSSHTYHLWLGILFVIVGWVGFSIFRYGHEKMINENDHY